MFRRIYVYSRNMHSLGSDERQQTSHFGGSKLFTPVCSCGQTAVELRSNSGGGLRPMPDSW